MVAVHSAIPQALYDSQVQTIHMLKTFLLVQKSEDYEKLLPVLDDFCKNLKCPRSCQKQRKDPSEYNLFIRDRINEYKKQYPDMNGHDLMRMATSAWKISHPKNV